MELKELDEFLLARAMEHDSPTLLFGLACEYLLSTRVIRPSPDTVVRRVVHARERAQLETYDRLAHELTPQRRAELDALLVTDLSVRMSRLRWRSTGPVEASAAAVRNEVEKLGFVRGLGADTLDLSVLPAERRRFLATLGRRLDDEVSAHISPAHSENINFIGAIEVDIGAELAQLGPTDYRPLRVRDTLFQPQRARPTRRTNQRRYAASARSAFGTEELSPGRYLHGNALRVNAMNSTDTKTTAQAASTI